MPPKKDLDTTAGLRLLRLFRKLMLDGKRHFQLDLAEEFQCSPQCIMRMVGEIEQIAGTSLEMGIDGRRRWYRIRSLNRSRLGLDFEEIRYLSVCRDLAASTLPEQVMSRVDGTIFELSVLLADRDYERRDKAQQPALAFYAKGRIDYTPHFEHIEKLLQAAEEKRICLVRYKASGQSQAREHRFAPGRMASMNGALYILGATATDDYKAMKQPTNLTVHRIEDVAVTDKVFSFPLPDADTATFGLTWHEPRTFNIHFKPGKAADYVRERIWADEQKMLEQEDGGLELEITTRSEPELLAWVRSFGEEAGLLV